MAVSSSSVQQARQLIADRLREIREQAGLTGRDHARACGWHPAKTSRIENNAQANVELVSGYLTITQPREVAMYADTFAQLADLAVNGAEARTRIRSAIDSLR